MRGHWQLGRFKTSEGPIATIDRVGARAAWVVSVVVEGTIVMRRLDERTWNSLQPTKIEEVERPID